MQVSVESTGTHERRMTLQVPASDLNAQVDARLREIAKTARIKGFRPGKVPAKVVQQRFGAQVRSEILDDMLRSNFDKAVRDNELRIAGSPRIEPVNADADDSDVAFTATFEVVPDFGDIDVEKLEVMRHTAEIEDSDIDRMIDNLKLQRRTWNAVERAAKEGDAVDVETWSTVDGERLPSEGVERGVSVLGTGGMYPEIEKELEGMSAGEQKEITVQFPAEWRVPQLAGKSAQVNVKIERVSEPVMPEVDAEFIRSFGVKSGDLEQFKSDIRTNLERELKGALMNRLRREVGEQLISAYQHIDLPPKLVENEARAMLRQNIEQARQQGQRIDNVPENAHENFMDAAQKRALVGLLVGEVARRNDLRLDPKRLTETLRLIASTYEEPEQVIDLYRNDPQLMAGLQNRVMEEQVIDWIADRANHTEKKLSFQEAIS